MNDKVEHLEKKNKIEELTNKKDLVSSKLFSSSDQLKELEYKRIIVKEKLREKLIKAKNEDLNNFYAKKNKIANLLLLAKDHLKAEEYKESIMACESVLELDKDNQIAKHLIKDAEDKNDILEKSLQMKASIKKERDQKLQTILKEALRFFNANKYQEAIKVLDALLNDFPESLEANELLVSCQKKISDEKERVQLEEIKKAERKEKINLLLKKSELFLKDENFKDAKNELEQVLLYEPSHKEANERLFFVEKNIKEQLALKLKEEELIKRKLLLSDINSKKYASQGDYSAAIKELESILKECPIDEIQNIYEKIEAYETKHRLKIKEKQNELIEFQKAEEKEKDEIKKQYEKAKQDEIESKLHLLEIEFEKALLSEDINTAKKCFDSLMHSYGNDKNFIQILKNMGIRLKQVEKEKLQEQKIKHDRFYEYFKKGIELHENKNFYDSLYYLKIACEINPSDNEASEFLERVLNKIQNIENVNDSIDQKRIEFEEKFIEFKMKIKELVDQKLFKDALNECRKMSLIYPSQSIIEKESEKIRDEFRIHNEEEAKESKKIEEITKKKEEAFIEEILVKAKLFMRENKFTDALNVLYDALPLISNNLLIEKFIDEVEYKRNKSEEKKKDEVNSERQKQKTINKLILEGDVFFELKQFQKSIDSYEEALFLIPNDNELLDKIQNSRDFLIQSCKAKELELFNRDEKIKEYKLKISECMNSKQFDKAIVLTEEVLLLSSNDESMQKMRINLIEDKLKFETFELKKINDEKELLKKEAEQKNKEKQHILSQINDIYNNGLAFIREEKFEKGIQEWKKIKIIDPTYKLIDDEIRQLRMKMRENEIENLQEEEVKKQNESSIQKIYIEGKRLVRAKQYLNAIETFEQALFINKDDKRILAEIEKTEKLFEDNNRKLEKYAEETSIASKEKSMFLFKAKRHEIKEEYKEVLSILEKAYELYPDDKEIQNGIINAEQHLMNKDTLNRF